MVMLLRARGKGRGRGGNGLFSKLIGGLMVLLGGSRPRKNIDKSRGSSMVPGWLALGVALACFGGGYVVRGYIAPTENDDAGGTGLRTGPRAPGVIDVETQALTSHAFFVAAYDLPAGEARQCAIDLSRYLQGLGVAKARPYLFPVRDSEVWVVAVYYDGPADKERTRKQLKALPVDVPDANFTFYRNSEEGWPTAYEIR